MNRDALNKLKALADEHGLVRHEQALSAGVAPHTIQHLRQKQVLEPVRRGVSRLVGAPRSWEAELKAATLAAEPALASHLAAGHLWRAEGMPAMRSRPEILVERGRRVRLSGVKVHTSRYFGSEIAAEVRGIPVTTPARTLVDLSGRIPGRDLARCTDDLLRRKLVDLEGLRSEAQRHLPQGGRTRLSDLLEILADRQPGNGLIGSQLEAEMAAALDARSMPRARRQLKVVVAGRTFYIDFGWDDVHLGLEVLGFEYHGLRSRFDHDYERLALLAAAGWTMLPVTSAQSFEAVAARAEEVYWRLKAGRGAA